MDQPTKSTPQLYPARLRRFARLFPGATAKNPGAAESSDRHRHFLFLKPDAETSTSEEPGARKGHAGICAGAVWVTGRPTAMAQSITREVPMKRQITFAG